MRKFIKNGYLFLILFIILLTRDYLLSFFSSIPKTNIKDSYVLKLEKEIEDLNIIKNKTYLSNFYYGKVLYQNPYKPGYLNILINSLDIKKGDLVLSDDSLIGIINDVKFPEASVKSVYTKDFLLGVTINNCYGILKGNIISGIDNYCEVHDEDEVYTSDNNLIKDKVLIGKIVKINKDLNEVSNTYEIKFAKEYQNLNYLIIIGGV